MPQQPRPVGPLLRWLETLEYNAVRRIEDASLLSKTVRDDGRPLRGVLLADDLCMTRQRTFYALSEDRTKAVPVSTGAVAKTYALKTLQDKYNALQAEWKRTHRSN